MKEKEPTETVDDILAEMRKCPVRIRSQIPHSRIDEIMNPPMIFFSDEHRAIVRGWAYRIEAALERAKRKTP